MVPPRIAIRGSQTGIGGSAIFVIADIGKNFIQTEDERPNDEYLQNAIDLIDAAADAGVDAVKFQTHIVEDEQYPVAVSSPHAPDLDRYKWVERNTRATPLSFWKAVKAHAEKRGVIFFSTPMSRKAAQLLIGLDVPLWKIASGDVRDRLLLSEVLATKRPIILSTGMTSFAELREIMRWLLLEKASIILLYCISKYPCPPEDFALASMRRLATEYPVHVGLSDHSLGLDVALAAAASGAAVIEKHFSLSRDLWGPDHKVSMTPAEMASLVSALRSKKHASIDPSPYMGDATAELEGAKNVHRPYFEKSLVAGRDIAAGHVLTADDVFAMRPRIHVPGLPSWDMPEVIGKQARKPIKRYDPLTLESFA